MSISSVWHGLPKGVQTATKVGGLIAGGAGIVGITAACTSAPKESKDVVREEFNRFDRDGKDGVGMHEAELSGQRTYTTTSDYRFFDSDYVTRTYSTRQQSWTDSAVRGVGAADERGNKDAVASWQELTSLAMTYDVDGDAMLGGDERKKFERDYGVTRIDHGTRIINEYSLPVYDPLPRYEPAPYNPPYYEPPTSGGDSGYDYGNGSGNSSGDSGGGWDTGNSGGDSGGYVPSPGSGSSGDSGGSSSNGNSTSNGNAEW